MGDTVRMLCWQFRKKRYFPVQERLFLAQLNSTENRSKLKTAKLLFLMTKTSLQCNCYGSVPYLLYPLLPSLRYKCIVPGVQESGSRQQSMAMVFGQQ